MKKEEHKFMKQIHKLNKDRFESVKSLLRFFVLALIIIWQWLPIVFVILYFSFLR